MSAGDRLEFHDFELDLGSGTLLRSGQPVQIYPQSLRVLALLATRAGELVTREELRRDLWGDAVHVDFEQGINFCIRHLRSVLDDHARRPRFIATVRGSGYRFVAPVRSAGVAAPAAQPPRFRLPRRRAWAALLLVAVGGTAASARLRGAAPGAVRVAPPAEVREAFAEGARLSLAADPERRLAGQRMLDLAVSQAPDYAPGHAMVARVRFADRWRVTAPMQIVESIEAPASRAIQLDPALPAALQVLAGVDFRLRFDWASAERRYRAALEAEPDLAEAHHYFGLFLLARGRFAEGLSHVERAAELGLSGGAEKADRAYGWYLAGDLERALRLALEGHGDAPTLFRVVVLTEVLLARGETRDALQIVSAFGRRTRLGAASDLPGLYRTLQRAMRASGGSAWGSEIALYEHRLGGGEAALADLAEACRERSGWSVQYVLVDPRFAPLRASRGFGAVRRCLETPLRATSSGSSTPAAYGGS